MNCFLKILVIFAFISLTVNNTAYSQNYFNLLHDPIFSAASSMIEEPDGYVVLGQRPTYVDRKIMLMKVNIFGDSVWKNYYGNDTAIYYAQELLKHNNGFMVAGSVKDSVNTNNFDFFLARFDSLGYFVWLQRFGGPLLESCNSFIRTQDNGFILAGESRSFSGGNRDFYMIKVDTLGNLLWQKTFGGSNTDVCNGLVETTDFGLILTGYTNSFNSNYDLWVIKTDSVGNMIWQKYFDTGFDDNGGVIIKTSDDNYLITTGYPSGSPSSKGRLIKIDPLGNTIWLKDYIYSGGKLAPYLSAIENSDGTFITGGFSTPSGGSPLGNIFKTDPLGNLLWMHDYYTRTDVPQYINDIISTSDSGFAFCGTALPDTGINNARTWVVKVDCFGCDSNLCYYADSACYVYDCTLYPIDAFFTSSVDTIDLAYGNSVLFTNSSLNTSARKWNFGDGAVGYTTDTISHAFTQTGAFTVSLIVYHGMCTDTFYRDIIVINTVGVNEIKNGKYSMKIYPNPFTENTNIEFSVPEGTNATNIVIYDLAGKAIKVIPVSGNSGTIHFTNDELKQGTYYCTLLNERQILTQTIISIIR